MKSEANKVITLELDIFEAGWLRKQVEKPKRGETALSKAIRGRFERELSKYTLPK